MSARRNPHVAWVGTARSPAFAVACGTCNVTIGQPCEDWQPTTGTFYTRTEPHRARIEYAEALGFRARTDAPLMVGSKL